MFQEDPILKYSSRSFKNAIVTLSLTLPLVFSCGKTPEEENLEKAVKLNVMGQTIHTDDQLFSLSCNQFYFNFLKRRSDTSCVAVTASAGLTSFDISSPDGSVDISATREGEKLTIDGTSYYCYLFNGDMYTQKGKQIFALGPIFLSKSTATKPSDLNGDDVDYIAVDNADVCDAFK